MKKYLLILLLVGMLIPFNVYASGGKLREASITSCGGVKYGQHGGDDHWHVAKLTDNGWYPDGSAIYYSNPCGKATTKKTTKKSTTKSTTKKTTVKSTSKKTSTTTNNKTTTKKKTTASKLTTTEEPTTTSTSKLTTTTTKRVTKTSTTTLTTIKEDINNTDTESDDFSVGGLIATGGISYGVYKLVKSKKRK